MFFQLCIPPLGVLSPEAHNDEDVKFGLGSVDGFGLVTSFLENKSAADSNR